MKGTYSKVMKILPEMQIASVFGLLVFALWGLGAQAASPEAGPLAIPEPKYSLEMSTAPSVFGSSGDALAVTPGADTVAESAEPDSQEDGEVVHLPQISEVLNAAPQIPAIKIELPPVVAAPAPEAPIQDSARVEHARELLGKFYNRSVVKNGEKVAQVGRFIRERTRKALRPEFKKYAKEIAKAVMRESDRHGFDPVFLMAVIGNESNFNPHAIGSVGEIGLMQITPATAEWVAKKFNIKWRGKKSLRDPKTNIRLGSAYLAYLREQFDSHSRLYLAAYNMGSLNVNRALDRSIWPKDYPRRVMKRYIRYYGDLRSELKPEREQPKHKT